MEFEHILSLFHVHIPIDLQSVMKVIKFDVAIEVLVSSMYSHKFHIMDTENKQYFHGMDNRHCMQVGVKQTNLKNMFPCAGLK